MGETIKYPYSLRFSIANIVLMLLLMAMLFTNVLQINRVLTWLIFSFFALIFVLMVALLIIKRLIPALKGRIALELRDDVLIDYIRNITINWTDIKAIERKRGRSASTLIIDLKWESDYGSQIAIPLRWVKGNDIEVYENVLMYFEQYAKGNQILN